MHMADAYGHLIDYTRRIANALPSLQRSGSFLEDIKANAGQKISNPVVSKDRLILIDKVFTYLTGNNAQIKNQENSKIP